MLCWIRFQSFGSAICFLCVCPALLSAQTSTPHPIISPPQPPPDSSSTASSPPSNPVVPPELDPAPLRAWTNSTISLPVQPARIHPFSAVGIQIKAGFAGIGIDLATPLTQHLNLRGGGSFAAFNADYDVDGMRFAGHVDFRSATVNLDWYPSRGGFRISPGITVYNGNSFNATLSVPGGQNFDLGDGTYNSSPSDPVRGIGSMTFGRRIAPNFTVGWGNMIPRSGRHFSVPFEIGFQYIGPPRINFNLSGTACNNSGCANIATDPTSQADLQQELADINNQIAPLRFYPIVSIGIAWAFGLKTHASAE